jgi:hypothetical protein
MKHSNKQRKKKKEKRKKETQNPTSFDTTATKKETIKPTQERK